jgi:oxygen-independent coproporphyrinogen-3 oxidase
MSREPLSIYVHIPFCTLKCSYCDFNSYAGLEELVEPYVDALIAEMGLWSRYARGRPVATVFFGGGTPSLLPIPQVERIVSAMRDRFTVAAEAEVTLEANPGTVDGEYLRRLLALGVNRLSLGVQSFHDDELTALDRIHSAAEAEEAYRWAREAGFRRVNLDLIYGLPYQTPESFGRTLARVIELKPDRLAVFNYAHLPRIKKHQRLIPEEALPSPAERLAILKGTIEQLTDAGYAYIGMDHFARPDDELAIAQREGRLYRNFQGYSTKAGCDLIAFGMSAISQVRDVYAQNDKDLRAYESTVARGSLPTVRGYRLSAEDRMRRDLITRIMCNFRVDIKDFERQYEIDFRSHFADALEGLSELESDGLVELNADALVVTQPGRLFIRNVAMHFDAYLPRQRREAVLFSKTV